MQGLLSQCNVQYVTVTETDLFVNVNTKEEYNELQKKKS